MGKVKVEMPRVKPVKLARDQVHFSARIKFPLWILSLAIVAWLSYSVGAKQLALPTFDGFSKTFDNREKLKQLKQERESLSESIAQMKRTAKVEQESLKNVQKTLQEKDLTILKLKEELDFYRTLLAPEKVQAGIGVRKLSIVKLEKKDLYSFNLLLSQFNQSGRAIKGTASISIDGRQAGEMHRLDVKILEMDSESKIKYSFKYFERLSGTFKLPNEFQPLKVSVEVKPSGKTSEALVSSYDWDQLMTGE